jgi:hypothetical protein
MTTDSVPFHVPLSAGPVGAGAISRRVLAATLAAIIGLFGALCWSGYQASRREAQITVSNLAEMLALNIGGAFDRAQSDLRVFVPQLTDSDLEGRMSAARRADIEARMGYHLRFFPEVFNSASSVRGETPWRGPVRSIRERYSASPTAPGSSNCVMALATRWWSPR